MAYLALFVALGGGAYAVTGIPDSAGVFHGCVSKKSGVLRVVKAGAKCRGSHGHGRRRDPGEVAITWSRQGPRGLQGPGGPPGAGGQPGANGQSFDATATLPSGQTLAGVWGVGGGGTGVLATQVQFTPHLNADLPAASVRRVVGSAVTSQCPGPGQAARGFFCLYEQGSNANFLGIFDGTTAASGANRTGAVIQYTGTGAASQAAIGSWAVTAP